MSSFVFAFALLTACEGEQPVPIACEQVEDEIAPMEGTWQIATEMMSFDDCDMGDWVVDEDHGQMEVTLTGRDEVSIVYSSGTEYCDLADDGSFTCEPRQDVDTTPADKYNLDAQILLDIVTTGSFPTESCLEMNLDIQAACEGDDCWLVELVTKPMPCPMGVLLEAEAL